MIKGHWSKFIYFVSFDSYVFFFFFSCIFAQTPLLPPPMSIEIKHAFSIINLDLNLFIFKFFFNILLLLLFYALIMIVIMKFIITLIIARII